MPEIYLHGGIGRQGVYSLRTLLLECAAGTVRMNPDEMKKEDARTCRWIGFGISKGLTSPAKNITVFSTLRRNQRGLHHELVKGFPGIDPFPLCYEEDHKFGFGDFVRWVYFSDPKGKNNFLGIDFSLACRPTSGVANSVTRAWEVLKTIALHGMPLDVEVVLLNHRMCETAGVTRMRQKAGLVTLGDWILSAESILAKGSKFCPRCGQKTLDRDGIDRQPKFCYRCGCEPDLFCDQQREGGRADGV